MALDRREMDSVLTGEADEADGVANYAQLRKALAQLFGDKLSADNTTVDMAMSPMSSPMTVLLYELEQSGDAKLEAYGRFMRAKGKKRVGSGSCVSGLRARAALPEQHPVQ